MPESSGFRAGGGKAGLVAASGWSFTASFATTDAAPQRSVVDGKMTPPADWTKDLTRRQDT